MITIGTRIHACYKNIFTFDKLSSLIMVRTKKAGRKGKAKGNRDRERENNGDGEKRENKHTDYPTTKKTNANYEQYYKEQGIIKEAEWEAFLESMRQPLPTTFRITGFRGEAQEMLKIIKNEYITKLVSNDECPVHSLPWYPNELGWQIDLSRREIRHQQDLQPLKEFLLNETESGNISRQEAVSMIPPLVLDVKPHHKVLDMCAAPGSKTAQLIELLHADGENVPEGYVIANDVCNKRCYLMVHQVKRLQSPCCAIVNHDATTLPNIRIGEGIKDFVQYDRVLCDVPCSGDGTLRKNVDIWSRWNANIGPNLHKVQMKILKRGLELLAVGGRLVYSTCSLNPVENEAIIASMMEKCKGCIELIDVSSQLPNLKYNHGLSSWKVFNKKMEHMSNLEETRNKGYSHFEGSMFPPDNAKDFNLERCIRVLPHHQNTGGFFIVAIQKTATLPWMRPVPPVQEVKKEENVDLEQKKEAGDQSKEASVPVETVVKEPADKDDTKETTDVKSNGKRPGDALTDPTPTKHKKMHGYKEDPFLFLEANDPFWDPIQKFYGIRPDFPIEQVMYRAETGHKRTIYFVSNQLRNIIRRNSDRIRFINLGLRIFGRSPSPLVPDCEYRISQEGLTVLGAECITRCVQLSREDMVTFMTYDNPFFDKMSTKAREDLKLFSIGCILMHYKPEAGETKPSCNITVCGWRGKSSLRTFLSKNLRAHYLRLFGVELEEILKVLAKKENATNSETGDTSQDSAVETEENTNKTETVKSADSEKSSGAEKMDTNEGT
ncbi:NSUN2 [Mytilus edulis]|uniref:tRNA (cytosine(34)-C(5))-methyltransferase n=1 Tax=Mytilus edulis TaxID=6550 RepID=A0A8S3S9C5_MYTED|nr:NSUN2 [Mytilus edulis]